MQNTCACIIFLKITHDFYSVKRVIFVSGRLYHDLSVKRKQHGKEGHIALIRIEELCPFPVLQLQNVIKRYNSEVKDWVWCQEEGMNNGAYSFIEPRLQLLLSHKVHPIKLLFIVEIYW